MNQQFFSIKCLFFCAIIAFNSGCINVYKTSSLASQTYPLPDTFHLKNNYDTSHFNIQWRQYFKDTSLVLLIEKALAHNINLKASVEKISIMQQNIGIAHSHLLPSMNIAGGVMVNRYAQYTQEYLGNSTTFYDNGKVVPNPLNDFNVRLNTMWEIDIWGKLTNQKKRALSQYLETIEAKNFIVSNLVAEIASYYYRLIALDKQLEIIYETIQKQKDALETVKLQKEVARANELAVQQFEAELLHAQFLEQECKEQINFYEYKLNFLLGQLPQNIQRSKNNLITESIEYFKIGVPSNLLTNRPDIKQSELKLKQSGYDICIAKAAFFPQLNLLAGLGFQSFNPNFLLEIPASITFLGASNLIMPIVNRKALKAQFNNAKSNQILAMYDYQQSILNGYIEVVTELSKYEYLNNKYRIKKNQSYVLSEAVLTATELYKYAQASYLDILIAQQNFLRTNLELIDIIMQKNITKINLYKALGGGWQ